MGLSGPLIFSSEIGISSRIIVIVIEISIKSSCDLGRRFLRLVQTGTFAGHFASTHSQKNCYLLEKLHAGGLSHLVTS